MSDSPDLSADASSEAAPDTDERVRAKTRALLERLANTEHRRKLTADRIFRQLRKEDEAREAAARKTRLGSLR